jgi:hypothetical protein
VIGYDFLVENLLNLKNYLFLSLSKFFNTDLAMDNALLACFSAFFFQIVRRVFVFVLEVRFLGTAIYFIPLPKGY